MVNFTSFLMIYTFIILSLIIKELAANQISTLKSLWCILKEISKPDSAIRLTLGIGIGINIPDIDLIIHLVQIRDGLLARGWESRTRWAQGKGSILCNTWINTSCFRRNERIMQGYGQGHIEMF